MKLRNKKTGQIIEHSDLNKLLSLYEVPSYDSLAELNEDWEDYEEKEPLINLKIDNNQKLLIEEAVALFASQDMLRGGYHIEQAQEILNLLNNKELCGEGKND